MALRLDLGGGLNTPEGYLPIGFAGAVVLDLEQQPFPFADSCADEIRAYHVMEHIHNFVGLMNECHRILKPEGFIDIEVPMFPHGGSVVDPMHCRFFIIETFEYLTPRLAYFNYGFLPWEYVDGPPMVNQHTFIKVQLKPLKDNRD